MAKNVEELANALKATQESLAAINEQLEATKVAMASVVELQAQLATIHSEAQTKFTEITNAVTQSIAARTSITDLQTVIAAKSDHIENAQLHGKTWSLKFASLVNLVTVAIIRRRGPGISSISCSGTGCKAAAREKIHRHRIRTLSVKSLRVSDVVDDLRRPERDASLVVAPISLLNAESRLNKTSGIR